MKLKSALLLSALAMTTANAVAQNQNPIINSMYSADPSARVFGDTLWVYPSHDKDDALSFSMEDYHTFSTTDMKTWTDHGVIFNPTKQTKWAKEAAWAPDCIYRNGKYYLYYPTDKKHIGVAVSDDHSATRSGIRLFQLILRELCVTAISSTLAFLSTMTVRHIFLWGRIPFAASN